MKTQVIYLEPQDELQTIQDKINWGKSERILLVYPTASPPLRRKIDLVRLERFSRKKGSQFAVVTNRQEISTFAKELGISVFPNRRVAQLADWNQPEIKSDALDIRFSSKKEKQKLKKLSAKTETSKWMKNKFVRILIFLVGIFSIFSVFFVLFPSADIVLTPITRTQTLNIDITIDPNAKSYNLVGVIPADTMTITISGEKTRSSSGSLVIPNTYAVGSVVFTNLTDQEFVIPAGTIIRTDSTSSQNYLTTEDANMPADVGTSIEVKIKAENPGEIGNIDSEMLTQLEGKLSFKTSVINPESISGGMSVTNRAPSNFDFERLHNKLLKEMELLAKEAAKLQAPAQDILISEVILDYKIISEEYTPEQGQPGSELNLVIEASYDFMVVRGETLNSMLKQILDSQLGEQEIAQGNTFSIEINSGDSSNFDVLNVIVERQIYSVPDNSQVIQMIRGKEYNEALSILTDQNLYSEDTIITTNPDWWPWLPYSPLRINIEVSYR